MQRSTNLEGYFLVGHRYEGVKVRVDTRERFFSMDGGREPVSVTIDVYIQKWKHIVVLFFVRELDVGML